MRRAKDGVGDEGICLWVGLRKARRLFGYLSTTGPMADLNLLAEIVMRRILLLLIFSYSSTFGQTSEALIQSGLDLVETRPDSAILVFNRAIQLDSTNFEPWYYIAHCYSKTGNFEQTVNYSKESLKRNPQDWGSLVLLGVGEIFSVDKVKGCETLEKALAINDTDEVTNDVFKLLCGKYYRVTINTELKDSTLIDRINDFFKDRWEVGSIGEESGCLQFNLLNKRYWNYLEGISFEVEWGIHVFDSRGKVNLPTVQERYKGFSGVEYRAFRSGRNEVVMAIMDGHVKEADINGYLSERELLIKELKRFVKTPFR